MNYAQSPGHMVSITYTHLGVVGSLWSFLIKAAASSRSEVTAAPVCATRLPERALPKCTEQVCLRSLLQCVF